MAYVYDQVPVGVPYYDTTAGAVKQDGQQWRIMEDTQSEIFCVQPSNTVNKTWAQPTSIPTGYVRVGYPQGIAGYIAWMLNNLP